MGAYRESPVRDDEAALLGRFDGKLMWCVEVVLHFARAMHNAQECWWLGSGSGSGIGIGICIECRHTPTRTTTCIRAAAAAAAAAYALLRCLCEALDLRLAGDGRRGCGRRGCGRRGRGRGRGPEDEEATVAEIGRVERAVGAIERDDTRSAAPNERCFAVEDLIVSGREDGGRLQRQPRGPPARVVHRYSSEWRRISTDQCHKNASHRRRLQHLQAASSTIRRTSTV